MAEQLTVRSVYDYVMPQLEKVIAENGDQWGKKTGWGMDRPKQPGEDDNYWKLPEYDDGFSQYNSAFVFLASRPTENGGEEEVLVAINSYRRVEFFTNAKEAGDFMLEV